MPFLRAFGSYLPERIVSNAEIGAHVGCDAEWITNVSGIEQRRFAADDESVADLALRAAQSCLDKAKLSASALGMILIASGSTERQFPGDGAGACLVSPTEGKARVLGSALHSDGAFAEDLRLPFDRPLEMNGRSVILQASRKVPRAISELLEKHGRKAADVGTFLMHQANQNLIDRVALALEVPADRFYSNIARYGNTSSASMLIAAAEWAESGWPKGEPVCFAAFGAGFHWGALLAQVET